MVLILIPLVSDIEHFLPQVSNTWVRNVHFVGSLKEFLEPVSMQVICPF